MLPKELRIRTKADLRRVLHIELRQYGKKDRGNLLLPFREQDVLAKHCILLRRLQNRHAIHIPLNCCQEGLKLMHLGPVLINGSAQVGKNCSLHMNTGLVANGITGVAPQLDDGVVVGFGAVVGDVHIARDVAIGANAVVTRDVAQENVAVAGSPARIVSQNGWRSWNQKEGGHG